MNNRNLAIAFGVLLLIYLLSKVLGGNRERSFDPQILSIDTSQVTKLQIDPGNESLPFALEKTGSGWSLTKDAEQFSATTSSVGSLLMSLQDIRADRVVSKNPDRWKDYSVDDSTGTRIQIFDGNNLIDDIIIGRFNFNQATRSGISYVRLTDEDAVYSVDGFLSMSLSQGADNYRDKTLTSLNSDDITRITLLENGAQAQYQLVDSVWRDETGNQVDSAKMVSYLNNIRSVSGSTFVTDEATQLGQKLKTLQIEGNNMPGPVTIDVYASQDTTQDFVLQSSTNREGYFFSDSSGIYRRLIGSFEDPRSKED